jgi:hypothetical protein
MDACNVGSHCVVVACRSWSGITTQFRPIAILGFHYSHVEIIVGKFGQIWKANRRRPVQSSRLGTAHLLPCSNSSTTRSWSLSLLSHVHALQADLSFFRYLLTAKNSLGMPLSAFLLSCLHLQLIISILAASRASRATALRRAPTRKDLCMRLRRKGDQCLNASGVANCATRRGCTRNAPVLKGPHPGRVKSPTRSSELNVRLSVYLCRHTSHDHIRPQRSAISPLSRPCPTASRTLSTLLTPHRLPQLIHARKVCPIVYCLVCPVYNSSASRFSCSRLPPEPLSMRRRMELWLQNRARSAAIQWRICLRDVHVFVSRWR